jgi:hypothetical protein
LEAREHNELCAETGALIIFVFPLADHREATKEFLQLKASQLQPAEELAGSSTTVASRFRRPRQRQKSEGPTGVEGSRHDPVKSPLPVCVEESGEKAAMESMESMDSVEDVRSVEVNLRANELEENSRAPEADSCDNVEEVEAKLIEKKAGNDTDIHICEDPEFANALSLVRPLADNCLLPIESEFYSQKIKIRCRLIKHESEISLHLSPTFY